MVVVVVLLPMTTMYLTLSLVICLNKTGGYFKVAGLLRQIKYENGTDIDGSSSAWGVSSTGKVNLDGGDDIRVIFNTGSGLGRYIGLNAANGAVVTPDGDLEAIDSYGYVIAYRRLWNAKMRSSITSQH